MSVGQLMWQWKRLVASVSALGAEEGGEAGERHCSEVWPLWYHKLPGVPAGPPDSTCLRLLLWLLPVFVVSNAEFV